MAVEVENPSFDFPRDEGTFSHQIDFIWTYPRMRTRFVVDFTVTEHRVMVIVAHDGPYNTF